MAFNPETAVSREEALQAEGQQATPTTKLQVTEPKTEQVSTFNPDRAVDEWKLVERDMSRKDMETIAKSGEAAEALGLPKEIGQIAGEWAIQPLFEIGRGWFEGQAHFSQTVNAIGGLTEAITGGIIPSGELFKDEEMAALQEAQNIPETNLDDFSKAALNLTGGAIPIMSEFLLAGAISSSVAAGVTGASTAMASTRLGSYLQNASFLPQKVQQGGKFVSEVLSGMPDIDKFAVLGALEEYRTDPDRPTKAVMSGLAKGAATGIMINMGLQSAGAAMGLLHNFGKKAAEAYLTFITGSRRAAKRLVNNPKLLNLNPFSRPKSVSEIIDENKATKTLLKNQHDDAMTGLRNKQKQAEQVLKEQQDDALMLFRMDNKAKVDAVKTKEGFRIDDAINKMKEKVARFNSIMTERANNFYKDSLGKFGQVKKAYGKSIDDAVEAAVARNPGASVPYKLVNDDVKAIINKDSPFKITRQGKVLPATGATPAEEVNLLQRILDDFNVRKTQGGLGIKYLNRLKKDLNSISHKYYKSESGNKELAAMYEKLSDAVNPGTLVTKNKGLRNDLYEIHLANKDYGVALKRYDKAMQYYFRKEGGQYVPAPEKYFKAADGKNTRILNEMKDADKLLPKDDALFPKMEDIGVAMKKGKQMAQKELQLIRNQSQKNVTNTEKAAKEALRRHQKGKNKMTFEQRQQNAQDIRALSESQRAEAKALDGKLAELQRFYEDQEALRMWRAGGSGKTAAGMIQNVAAFKGAGVFAFGDDARIQLSAPLVGTAVGLSPIVSANLTRAALSANNIVDAVVETTLRNQKARQLIGMELIKTLTQQGQAQPEAQQPVLQRETRP